MARLIRKYVRVDVDNYRGVFYYAGRWRKFDVVGNAEMAMDVASMLYKLGHEVEMNDHSNEEVIE